MAFPVTLNGRTYTLADFEGQNYVDGLPDAFEDFVTQAGNIYTTTSTTSNSIGTGSKTFTVADSGKPYIVGTPLRVADTAAPSTNWIDGIVTSYSGTTLVVDAVAYAGSGTKTSWNINIGGGPIAYTGTLPIAQGGTGGTTAVSARTNLDVYSKSETYSQSEADSRFLNVSGEASNVTMTGDVTIGNSTSDDLNIDATIQGPFRQSTLGVERIYHQYINYRGVGDGTHEGYLILIPTHNGGATESLKTLRGSFFASRGSANDGNTSAEADVLVQTAYTGDTGQMRVAGQSAQYFKKLVKVEYSGEEYFAIYFAQSGGGPANGIYFDGIVKGQDSNFLFMAQGGEITSVVADPYGQTISVSDINGSTYFNPNQDDLDFVIKTEGSDSAFFVDASADAVRVADDLLYSDIPNHRVGIATDNLLGATRLTVNSVGGALDGTSSTTNAKAALRIAAGGTGTIGTGTSIFMGVESGSETWIQAQNASDNSEKTLKLNPVGGLVHANLNSLTDQNGQVYNLSYIHNYGSDVNCSHKTGYLGATGDPSAAYVLLCLASTGVVKHKSLAFGTVWRQRGSTSAGLISETHNFVVASAYSANIGGGYQTGTTGGRLYTCDYNGSKYIALYLAMSSSSLITADIWYGAGGGLSAPTPILVDDSAVTNAASMTDTTALY